MGSKNVSISNYIYRKHNHLTYNFEELFNFVLEYLSILKGDRTVGCLGSSAKAEIVEYQDS